MLKRIFLFIGILLLSNSITAQKAQKIGYIDMQYILENVPEYTSAQQKLTEKADRWKQNLDKHQNEIEKLKEELSNEKALLTKDLIEEKEEDIDIKVKEFNRLKVAYFGADGDLFTMRRQLAKPVQDQIYNAIQEIATRRKFDFVMDKSSDLIMLYTNKKYDISDLVINSITKTKKKEEINDKRAKKREQLSELSDAAKQKIADREVKKAALKEKIEAQKAERAAKRELLKKKIEEKKQAKIKAREEALKKRAEEENKKEE